jgi:predicted GIY-YIG superfamily endonuclease
MNKETIAVYIVASYKGVLYTGFTSDLLDRVEHYKSELVASSVQSTGRTSWFGANWSKRLKSGASVRLRSSGGGGRRRCD